MTSEAYFMTFGYRAFFDIFMGKIQIKNDIGGLIHDIWVSSFFERFHGKTFIKLTWDA